MAHIEPMGLLMLVLVGLWIFSDNLVWMHNLEPWGIFEGVPKFFFSPLPWNLSAGYEFLFISSTLNFLLIVPALLAAYSLWRHHPKARIFLLYGLVVVLAFSTMPIIRGIRQRQMVSFILIWTQFHALHAFARYALRSSGDLPAPEGDAARLPEPRQQQA